MNHSTYPRLDVSAWDVVADEPSGHDEKAWLRHPGTGDHWLYKPVTVKDGHTQWEDWAEKMASHAAGLLTVPCADIELAVRHGRRGCVSRNLRPKSYEMEEEAHIVAGVPEMSDPARTFATEVLKVNRGRLLRTFQ